MFALLAASLAGCIPQDVPDRIEAICARSEGIARASAIGTSRGNRPILLVELSAGAQPLTKDRAGTLILGGADGRRVIDSDLALHHCAKLVDDYKAGDPATRRLMEHSIVYVIPQLNPDGFALDRHGNAADLDLDRDGVRDEDTPDDLNGDGVISWMRWPDLEGEWIPDADDPRLMREADRDDGERGTHHFAIESRDSDGDGERAEDDAQGIWIDRSFPHRFDEFDRRTGPFPTHEPETRALADFVYSHRNIVMAFVWGRDDNLLATPKVVAPKSQVQHDGLLESDKLLFERAGERYRELTERKGDSRPRMDGSPWSWLYLQVGVPTFCSDIWRVPALEDEDKKDKLKVDKRLLARCESRGLGFVAWQKFEHPQLGEVEIGGFAHRDATTLILDDERDAAFEAHHAFVLETSVWRSSCRIVSFTKKQLADRAFELEAVLVNDGELPALTATGRRCRRFASPTVRIELGEAELLAGRTRIRLTNLAENGGTEKVRWVVTGAVGNSIRISLEIDPIGSDEKQVTL